MKIRFDSWGHYFDYSDTLVSAAPKLGAQSDGPWMQPGFCAVVHWVDNGEGHESEDWRDVDDRRATTIFLGFEMIK